MSPLQKKYYEWILAKNFTELNKGVKGKQATLLNIVMEVIFLMSLLFDFVP
jgi:chromodomain-helicase-DNA-binding protein 1